MTDAAGTPEAKTGESEAQKPEAAKDDSKKDDSQFKSEALKWKQKAEDYNKLEAQLKAEQAERQRYQELANRAYGGQQATDPRAALVAQLREQAAYDPTAAAALLNMEDAAIARAEGWLANQLLDVPAAKRDNVAKMIRNAGYQMGASDALSVLSDPETKTLSERLAEKEAELERLKNAKPNAVSPSSTTAANSSQDEGSIQPTMKRSDYLATLNKASSPDATDQDRARARELKMAVGSNKTKLENE